MNTIRLLVVALFFASLVSSCNSSKTSPPTTTTTAGEDSVFFTVDGVAYKFKIYSTNKVGDSSYTFIVADMGLRKGLVLGFTRPAIGTFSTKDSTPDIDFVYTDTAFTPYADHLHSEDSVTVIITELTPNFKATFHGTLNKVIESKSGPPTISITDGSINAKIR